MMAKGLNMPEISARLTISQSTVKFHLGNICNKLGVRTHYKALIVAARIAPMNNRFLQMYGKIPV